MSVFAEAFKAARAERREQHTTAILTMLGRFLGTYLPSLRRIRRTVLVLSGFAFLDFAVWQLHTIAGIAAVGLSLLILDALSTDGGKR